MNDERYRGTVRSAITKKEEAFDYVDSMAKHFVAARAAGFGSNKTAYCVYFESKGLLTEKDKKVWHITMVTNLMEADEKLIGKRKKEIDVFDYKMRRFMRASDETRVLTDQDWIDLRAEYLTAIDSLIDRSKQVCAVIRGEADSETALTG
ncbi:hypothetical protein [Sphingomonas rubra]|uniref:hypothetical protein n=1 Tax=Sphingomonas rubra TaxID=634430 RepID=UPI0011604DD1|nr:hypothetical protein [Sphingomonas rubra]